MKGTVTSNAEKHRQAIEKLLADPRKDRGKELQREAVLLGKEAIKWTPMPRGTVGRARKVVATYFRRAARPLKATEWESPSIKKLIRRRDIRSLQFVFQHVKGFYKNATVEDWTKSLVYRAMTTRGRVQTQKKVLTFDTSQRKSDLKRAQSAVGKAKGGWARGVTKYGGKVPAWIARHVDQGQTRGQFSGPDQFVEVTNRSRWAGDVDSERILSTAIRMRADAIFRKLEFLEQKRLEKM